MPGLWEGMTRKSVIVQTSSLFCWVRGCYQWPVKGQFRMSCKLSCYSKSCGMKVFNYTCSILRSIECLLKWARLFISDLLRTIKTENHDRMTCVFKSKNSNFGTCRITTVDRSARIAIYFFRGIEILIIDIIAFIHILACMWVQLLSTQTAANLYYWSHSYFPLVLVYREVCQIGL
jgi:hypothetical protein